MDLLSKCTCHKPSPYRPNEPWALQQALIYTYGINKMIHYSIYDCFATTCLIQPNTLYWTFQQALPSSSRAHNNPTKTNINQQIIKNINDDIELISDDDEIIVNQCIKITINNDMLYEEISNDDNELNKALPSNNNESLYEAISDDDNEPNPVLPPSDNNLCVNNHSMVDDDKNND
ncbi:unnamed protein product [Rotaria sordida]|uniref:Uncharacterized protein n=1 Tax=Rotaria sordida TaxID=392033 RepID=A0A820CXA2_9BILA|nr:unnamed protein product [Rotaria sordida]